MDERLALGSPAPSLTADAVKLTTPTPETTAFRVLTPGIVAQGPPGGREAVGDRSCWSRERRVLRRWPPPRPPRGPVRRRPARPPGGRPGARRAQRLARPPDHPPMARSSVSVDDRSASAEKVATRLAPTTDAVTDCVPSLPPSTHCDEASPVGIGHRGVRRDVTPVGALCPARRPPGRRPPASPARHPPARPGGLVSAAPTSPV